MLLLFQMAKTTPSPFDDMKKAEYKTLGDAVGMPDDQDKETLRKIMIKWDKAHPGVTDYTIKLAREEMEANSTTFKDVSDLGIVEKKGMSSTNRALIFELPEGLVTELEKCIPTLFRERKHFAWFVKNFPELRIPKNYEERTGIKF